MDKYAKTNFFGKELAYNQNFLIVFLFTLSLLVGVACAYLQEGFGFSYLDELYSIDFYSISHICAGLCIFLIFYYFSQKRTKSAILTTILMVLYEPLEYLLGKLWFPNIFTETLGNQFVDIIFNTIGVIIGVFLKFEIQSNVNPIQIKRVRIN